MNFNVSKKQKYITVTLIMTLYLYYFSLDSQERGFVYLLFGMVLTLVLSYFAQIPNSKIINTLITNILSISLVLGVMLSLMFFPNLSTIFKLLSLGIFAVLNYVVLLVNNVFLVVEDRKEIIPLYRVAITWSKILMAAVAIPFLAGLFKISVLFVYEVFFAIFVSALFFAYLLWLLKYSPDIKKYKAGELITILLFIGFIIGSSTLAVSFIPSESFLRALFVSSVLLFGISYIEGHLKNTINKKLITEHLSISLLFLILLLIFNP